MSWVGREGVWAGTEIKDVFQAEKRFSRIGPFPGA